MTLKYCIGDYPEITPEIIEELKQNDSFVKLEENEIFTIENNYYLNKFPGTIKDIYIRKSVKDRLEKAISSLGSGYKFKIFDGFRTIETQKYIFKLFKDEITAQNPSLSESEIIKKTIHLVPHPDLKPKKYEVLPHNSGGAIDLSLEKDGKLLDMGTEFDEVSKYIETNYFEREADQDYPKARWKEVKKNRRLLYSIMIEQGFSNHPGEWWHYNLGNCPWSIVTEKDWIYGEVLNPDFK